MTPPRVLLLHGIWESGAQMEPLRLALERAGRTAETLDLVPSSGEATLPELAAQLGARVDALGGGPVDVVGFSMGSLVARTWLQRHGGRERARKFVSISGPHAGTLAAYFSGKAGARQMRPGSALLRDLASDPDPWGDVEVHSLWTPFDLMIVPARSSRLPRVASERRFAVPLHAQMVTSPRVLEAVVALLR